MRVVYWKCAALKDRDNYSIRARTRKEAVAARTGQEDHYSQPFKVEIEYSDAFDLVVALRGEGAMEPYEPPASQEKKR